MRRVCMILFLCVLVSGCTTPEESETEVMTTVMETTTVLEETTKEVKELTSDMASAFSESIIKACQEDIGEDTYYMLEAVMHKLESGDFEAPYVEFSEPAVCEDGVLTFDLLNVNDYLAHIRAENGEEVVVTVLYDTPEELKAEIVPLAQAMIGPDVDVIIADMYDGTYVRVELQGKAYVYSDGELSEVAR